MTTTRGWERNRSMWIRLLEKQTGKGVSTWNRRIQRHRLGDEASLRTWLSNQGVKGYAQSLLVMEQFGYPQFVLASADQLIECQYADRPRLRPIYDAVIRAATGVGEVIIQARKTYVSLVSPRRTFARVQATTKTRLDLGLRLQDTKPGGRLVPSAIHQTMPLQIGLSSAEEVDGEVVELLTRAYAQSLGVRQS